jgi:ADP-ribose pyrophosphatase
MAKQFTINITNIIWSFDRENHQVNLLLVRRTDQPFEQFWALPETEMRTDEGADEAALRLVREKIGLKLASFHTEQLATFTQPERTPGQRTLSLAYMTFLPEMPDLIPGYGASDARWFSMSSAGDQNTFTNGQYQFSTTPITVQTDYYAALTERS